MKKTFLTLIAAAAMTACTNTNFQVRVTVPEDMNGKEMLLLDAMTGDTLSSATASDTIVSFTGLIDAPAMGVVMLPGSMPMAQLVVEEGKITVNSDGIASGTPNNDQVAEFNAAAEADQENVPDLALKFMENNPRNPFSIALFNSFSYLASTALIDTIAANNPDIAANPALAQLRESAVAREKTGVGAKYIDITLEQPNGKTLSLSGLMAGKKLTIVDFWASWCGPCRAEIPGLIDLYNTYRAKGLQVVGIDVWEREDGAGQKAIESMGIKYPVMLNGDRETTALYGVMAIPCILVIDSEGTIIARDLTGSDLADFISSRMK